MCFILDRISTVLHIVFVFVVCSALKFRKLCLSGGKNCKVKLSTFHSWTQIDLWKEINLCLFQEVWIKRISAMLNAQKMETKTNVKNRQSGRSQTKLDKKILIKKNNNNSTVQFWCSPHPSSHDSENVITPSKEKLLQQVQYNPF